jgi:DNA-binding MarR family transcriptional regulator
MTGRTLDVKRHVIEITTLERIDVESYAGWMADADSVDFCVTDVTSRYAAIHPEVEGVISRLSAISKHVNRAFEETLAGHGLKEGEYRLLLRLATRSAEHRMSAGELSRALMLSSGAMTNRLDRLEAAGLVRRVPDPRDRRGVMVELTAEGQRQVDTAVVEQAAKEIDVLSALSARELTSLNGLLRKVLGSLEARSASDRPAVDRTA